MDVVVGVDGRSSCVAQVLQISIEALVHISEVSDNKTNVYSYIL